MLSYIETCGIKPFRLQGGPAKVKPTYIFAGNVWHLNV